MTSFQRSSIGDFALANVFYIGARCDIYTVDANGAKTATLATLYASIAGADTLTNPQWLDSQGKFQQPVYIDEPVIAVLTPKNSANSHETGVIHADLASDAAAAAEASASQAAGYTALVQSLFNRVQSAVRSLQGITAFGLSLIGAVNAAAARTLLGAIDTTEAGVVAAAAIDATAIKQGKHILGEWGAGAIIPQTTNGCTARAVKESTTNDVMDEFCAYSASVIQYGQFGFRAPAALAETTITGEFEWSEAAGATAHNCVWTIEMQAQGDTDTIDSAWGTAVDVTDTGTGTTRRVIAFGAVTPAGTWAAGDRIIVRVSRKATDGADTLDVAAHLHMVTLFATYNAAVEP